MCVGVDGWVCGHGCLCVYVCGCVCAVCVHVCAHTCVCVREGGGGTYAWSCVTWFD